MNFEANSTFFITGGTGLVGSHFLFEISKKYKVKALSRDHSRCKFVRELFDYYDPENAQARWDNIQWIKGDLENIPLLEESLNNVDYVIHAAAFVSFYKKDFNDLLKNNFEGTRNLINVCLVQNIKKILHISSVAVFGKNPNNQPISEFNRWKDSPDNSGYSISKYLAEREVWRGLEEGLKGVILNPSIILGPGRIDESSSRLFQNVFEEGKYYPPGANAFIGVHDVVRAGLIFLENELDREQFILNADNISYQSLMSNIAKSAGVKAPSKEISKSTINIAYFLETIMKIFGRKSKLTKENIRSMFQTTEFNGTKITNTIGFDYTPLDPVIQEAIKFYKEKKFV